MMTLNDEIKLITYSVFTSSEWPPALLVATFQLLLISFSFSSCLMALLNPDDMGVANCLYQI